MNTKLGKSLSDHGLNGKTVSKDVVCCLDAY